MSNRKSFSQSFQTSLLVQENLQETLALREQFLSQCLWPDWQVEHLHSGQINDVGRFFVLNHGIRISNAKFSLEEYEGVFPRLEKCVLKLGFKIDARCGDLRNASLPVTEKDLGETWEFSVNYSNETVQGVFQMFLCKTDVSSGLLIFQLTESPKK